MRTLAAQYFDVWSERASLWSQGPVNPKKIVALLPQKAADKARGEKFSELSERRVTPPGVFWDATQRDGTVFPQSYVAAHLCEVTTPHSRRLVLRKNSLRRDDFIRVNGP